VFLAGTITHVVLPLGEVGIQRLPNEDPVMAALSANLRVPGFYFSRECLRALRRNSGNNGCSATDAVRSGS